MKSIKDIFFPEKNIFEKHFRAEALVNEKLRELIISATIIFLVLGLVVNVYFLAEDYKISVPGLTGAFRWIILLFIFVVLRSVIIRIIILKRMKEGKGLSVLTGYINAFIEISIPSAAIIIFTLYIEPIAALLSPILLLYFIFIILSSLELDFRLCIFTGITAAAEYLTISFYYLMQTDFHSDIPVLGIPMAFLGRGAILLVGGIIAGVVSLQISRRILKTYQVMAERNELEKVFGQQVSKEIVDDFIKNNMTIENRKREVCIMFLDIRKFSDYTEGKSPEEINAYQNSALGFMIDIINKNHGIVNQILGDGFMATFGAPIQRQNCCKDAVAASMEIVSALKKKNDNGEIPFTNIGIGLHTGEVITGNVGAAERKQYSITGNTVILAARLEQLNKEYNSAVLVSGEVLDKTSNIGLSPEFLASVTVKGRTEPVEVFRLA